MKALLRLVLLLCLFKRIWPFLFIPPVLIGIGLTLLAGQCAPKPRAGENKPPVVAHPL